MEAPAPADQALLPGRSVRQLLALFAVALAAPVLVFAAIVFSQFALQERSRLENDASDIARTVALGVDRDLTGLLSALDVLSTSAYLKAGDLEGFYRQGAEIARRQGIVPILADMSGRQVVNLRLPWGTPLPRTNVPWDRDAIAAGHAFVTDLFTGQVTGRPLYSVGMRVDRDGQPAYILTLSLEADRLQRLLNEVDVPPNYAVSIVDRSGTIMARSSRPEEFVGRKATEDLRRAATGQSGSWEGTTVDGTAVFGAYERSRLSGFRAAVGVRHADLNAPLWRSVSLLAALFAVVAALSVGLGLLIGRRITEPIRALADRAARLGRGEEVATMATGLHEANQVGAELASASVSLRARESELSEATDEIQRFAYIVSHDLRSPLVNIMGFTTELETLRADLFARIEALRGAASSADEALSDRRLAEDFDEAIAFIKTSIGKMDRLINAILRLSREGRREFHPERIDMDALLDGIRRTLTHQAESAGATIAIGKLPAVRSDRLALEQVFSNLLDNALKYGRAGAPGRIEVSATTTPASLVFTVKDNGRGIDERDGERVFELFRRSGAQDRPGEGIGLAHVRALVRRLGGTITLTSTLGQGSTFSVVLPRRWAGESQRKAA